MKKKKKSIPAYRNPDNKNFDPWKKVRKKFKAMKFDNYLFSDPAQHWSIGIQIYDLRSKKGLSVLDSLIKLDITYEDYEKIYKNNKEFRRKMKQAHKIALLWWKAELGRASLYKTGDINGIKDYLQMEFDYKLDGFGENETFNVEVTVRPKVD